MYKKYIKRIIDIIISFIILVLLIPLYILIGILIKLIDKGPILYKQIRTGKDGNTFKIYKFRTMKDGNVTKFGKILRSTSLDELPQFYNVLKGDMSIIGPRPWIPDYYERFNEKQKQRNKIRPGLVGLAQVNGRKTINVIDKINYDLKYIQKISIIEDIKILIKSLKVICSKEEQSISKNYIKEELSELEKNNSNNYLKKV